MKSIESDKESLEALDVCCRPNGTMGIYYEVDNVLEDRAIALETLNTFLHEIQSFSGVFKDEIGIKFLF